MLKIENVTVTTNGTAILRDISVRVTPGSVLILFGPNGSGKSTLLKAVMGLSGYVVEKGTIALDGRDITGLSTSERAKAGLGIMFQHPPKIHGVKLGRIAEFLSSDRAEVARLAGQLNIGDFLGRDVNVDLSGGEMKRAELFQLLLQKPRMLLLDEPESGVDVENIGLMGGILNDYIHQSGCGCLIITHTGHILDYVDADRSCVMVEGQITCREQPRKILEEIRKYGYEKCRECPCPK